VILKAIYHPQFPVNDILYKLQKTGQI